MAASTFTEHYELGVYQGPDYVSFLGTYNDAMRKIDNGMFQNQQNVTATASGLETVKGQMQTAQTNITAINQQLETYNIPGMKTELTSVNSRVTSIENELDQADLTDIGSVINDIRNYLTMQGGVHVPVTTSGTLQVTGSSLRYYQNLNAIRGFVTTSTLATGQNYPITVPITWNDEQWYRSTFPIFTTPHTSISNIMLGFFVYEYGEARVARPIYAYWDNGSAYMAYTSSGLVMSAVYRVALYV